MLLILAELVIPSFTIVWFGLGALLVGLLSWIGFSPELKWQLLLWILLSAGFTIAWFRWIKPLSKDMTKAGAAREALLGERCLLIKAPAAEDARGECRFSVPILGSDTWPCLIDGTAKVGDTVIVKDILGNAVLVAPVPSTSPVAD
jgi:membrane protein implicated in regulation of membrane protease activity